MVLFKEAWNITLINNYLHGHQHWNLVYHLIYNHITFINSLTAPSPTEKFRKLDCNDMIMVVSNECVVSYGDADHLQWLPASCHSSIITYP